MPFPFLNFKGTWASVMLKLAAEGLVSTGLQTISVSLKICKISVQFFHAPQKGYQAMILAIGSILSCRSYLLVDSSGYLWRPNILSQLCPFPSTFYKLQLQLWCAAVIHLWYKCSTPWFHCPDKLLTLGSVK